MANTATWTSLLASCAIGLGCVTASIAQDPPGPGPEKIPEGFVAGGFPVRDVDHLEPETGIFSEDDMTLEYSAKIRKSLILDDPEVRNVAQMVCLPSFSPEWAVTVRRGFRNSKWRVDLAVARDQIYSARRGATIKVDSASCPIDEATAETVHDVWHKMLLKTHYVEQEGLGVDGEDFHFTCSGPLPGKFSSSGMTGHVNSPDEGTLTGRLVEIGGLLREYAEKPPDKRDEVKARLKGRLKQLDEKIGGG